MLSRVLLFNRSNALTAPRRMVCYQAVRGFRSDFKNPYLNDPTPMNDVERQDNQVKPVWDRVFDHKKYMVHEGPLKISTGIAYLDVEPFPRMKLMKLYHLALDELRELPDVYGYKFLSQELTRYRMKVVDEHQSIRAIEDKIGYGMIEELIMAAHNELKLLRIMAAWKPWNTLLNSDQEEKEMLA